MDKTRLELAKELALAHGYEWDQADKAVQRAWLRKAKEAEESDVCPKCLDKGFIEREVGLFRDFCDCEKGLALTAEIMGESGTVPPEAKSLDTEVSVLPDGFEGKTLDETADIAREILESVKDDSDSGTGQPDTTTGSGDTGEPKRTRKPKAKKKARAKSG